MKKILFTIPNLANGGAENVVILLANNLYEKGNIVDIYVIENGYELENYLNKDIKVIKNKNIKKLRDTFQDLRKILTRCDYDVIISNLWPFTVVNCLSYIFSKNNAKFIAVNHNLTSKTEIYKNSNLIKKYLYRLSLFIVTNISTSNVCVSNGVKKDISRLSLTSEKKYKVIYNPVVLRESIKMEEEITKFINNRKILINIGNLKKQKNQIGLIRAFKEVCSKIDCCLLIAGEGTERKSLENEIIKLNLMNSVKLLGNFYNIAGLFKIANLFVLNSNYEGFGNVLIESLLAGVPVVSTDCPTGPREILRDGEFGKLVPISDEEELAKEIIRSLNSEFDKKKLMERGKVFNIENAVQEYIKLF